MCKEVSRIRILNNIFEHFQQISQWLPNHCDTAAKYTAKAEALIEVLEVVDCGSVGGFDLENPVTNETDFELYNRFLALVRKYRNQDDIKKVCEFNVVTLGRYFKQVKHLREKLLRQ